jgi:hypothetical protein
MSKLTPENYILFEFNSVPLLEYGTNSYIVVEGDGDIALVPGPHKFGLLLAKNVNFNIPYGNRFNNIRKGFSLGFWMNSVSMSDKIIDGSVYSTTMPLVSLGRTYDNGQEYEMNSGAFCLYEKCLFKNYNQLCIALIGPNGDKHEFESELYETGVFNHFLLLVDTDIDSIKLYINGVETILSSTYEGFVPPLIGTTGSHYLYLNNGVLGNKISYEKNTGIIDDFFIGPSSIHESHKIAKIISDGFGSYIEETSGNISEYVFDAKITFAQKTKISPPITAIDTLSGDIIAGTQDGLVLKGDSGYWNKKYVLSNKADLSDLQISYAYQSEDNEDSGNSMDGKIIVGQGLVLIKNGIIIS